MNLIDRLKLLINCNVDNFNELNNEDKKNAINSFRSNLNIKNYLDLFKEIENYLKSNQNPSQNEYIISLLLECIYSFSEFRNKINLLPNLIQEICICDNNLHNYMVLLEQLPDDFSVSFSFINIVNDYLSFLNNPQNEFYIHNYYSRIISVNNELISYVNKFSNDFDEDFIKQVFNLNSKEMPSL